MSPNDPNATVIYKKALAMAATPAPKKQPAKKAAAKKVTPPTPKFFLPKELSDMAAAAKVDSTQAVAEIEKVQAAAVSAGGSVPIGPSEITSAVVIVAGLATSFFGHDWGLTRNAQTIGIAASAVVTVGVTVARAIKHHALISTVRQLASKA